MPTNYKKLFAIRNKNKAKIKSAVAAALFKLFLLKNYKIYKICCQGYIKNRFNRIIQTISRSSVPTASAIQKWQVLRFVLKGILLLRAWFIADFLLILSVAKICLNIRLILYCIILKGSVTLGKYRCFT